jgi:poly(A) polymerase
VEFCEELLAKWTQADLDPPPLVSGHDLVQLGLSPGPRFKELLDLVREAQLDGRIGSAAEAHQLVRTLLERTETPP